MYKHLKAAWILLLVDNVPPQVRPSDSEWEALEPDLAAKFGTDKLARVDAELGATYDGDVEKAIADLDSGLWRACSPCDDDSGVSAEADELLNFMFENLL